MWKKGTLKHARRIYKLCMKRDGNEVCNYDRGWDLYPTDEINEEAMQILYFAEEN